ncbi:MAG: hypothetical protein ACOYN4_13185 [Bacteroidales bacterium]
MNTQNDILLTDAYDLLAQDGDLVTGDCLIQQQALLLAAGEGEWKQSPVVGVGLDAYLLDESEAAAFRKIRGQFKSDGLLISVLKKQTDGNLIIQSQHA